jgi:hypothetical protein
MLLALLLGCSVYEKLFDLLEEPPEPPCDPRTAWWEDADGDGVGNPAEVWVSCDAPAGWVAEGGDCDDADPSVTTGCDSGGGDTSGGDTSGGDTSGGDTSGGDTAGDTSGGDTAGDTSAGDTAAAALPRGRAGPR